MALSVNNLKIYYNSLQGQVKALDDVSFDLAEGEILGIAGESGCGKSTLSNALISFRKPMAHEGGSVELNGKALPLADNRAMDEFRFNEISIIPQYALNALNPIVKIEKYVQDLLSARGIEYGTKRQDLIDRLEFVRLSKNILRQYPIELSGGMKQRVVMVISTLLDPALLLCDEITSALDVTTQKLVSELIVEFRDRKIVNSVTFVTHDVPVLYQIADRIMILYAGQVGEIGSTEEIIHNPRHPYTRALTAAMPEVGIKYGEEKLLSIPGKPPALLNPPAGCRFAPRCPLASDKCGQLPPESSAGPGHKVYCWEADHA